MISKKRRELTMYLLENLVHKYDSVLTLSKMLGLPVTTIHSWRRRGNISDAGLKLIASNEKTKDIYELPEYDDIRNRQWY